ncbi:unnamed protein product [Phytophthora fragariaefolia]|uniref:Unnamed protein product n=1 Tax=Phytophthora fragariaefolia TaxID=1490495 RepID=A0A9W6WVN9_9STRA|nr:unnamed protein product [Phytophthora fragariaefolia]
MGPTLRSDRRLRSQVTYPTSPQVMSPTAAGLLTSPASGVDNTTRGILTDQDPAGLGLDENASVASDTTLSRSDAERLIRTLAGISGGRPLAEALFEGLRDLHSAPRPANTAEASPVTNQAPPSRSTNQRLPLPEGDDQRNLQPPPLGSMNAGSRYDDKELAGHTKALVSSPPIKLPKQHSKGDYKSWRSEVPLHFDTRMLGAITYGTERYDSTEGLSRAKYHEWFEARKNKAFSALALSLSVDLRTTFKIDDISDNMDAAAMLFERVKQHFEAGDGINSDYLLQELVTRRLMSGETVTAYVDDVAHKVTLLHQANGEFTEWQHASLLLSNCVEVYQGLAREHGDWINNHDRKSLTVAEAVQRLRAAEHQREQLRGQTGQQASQALRVAQVSAGQGQGQGASRKRSKAQRKRAKNVADKKLKTNCANCGGNGHCTGTRDRFAGLSLCGGQGNLDTSGAKPVYQDPPPSPIYSPTTPAESDDDDDHANVNVPSTLQQLQLQPTVPERQVQQVHQVEHATPAVQPAPLAMQPAVPGAAQSQWEGAARSLGPPPSCHANSAPQGLTPYERGKYEAQLQLQQSEFDRGRSPPRMFGRSRSPPRSFGRGGSPPSMHGRGCSPPRNFGRGGSPPRMYGRSRSSPRNFGRGGSPQRGRGRSRSPPPPWGRGSQPRAGPPMRDQPSDYGPPPQQRYDGPPPGRGPSPRRDDYHRRNLSPRRREQLPRRFDDRGPRQVNAVAQRQDIQATDANTIEWILGSGSQANVCGDLSLFTTLREDKTSKLDFANGTSEHANICGSVLLQILNEATGELEDRLLDDVMYLPSAKVNIISLGHHLEVRDDCKHLPHAGEEGDGRDGDGCGEAKHGQQEVNGAVASAIWPHGHEYRETVSEQA